MQATLRARLEELSQNLWWSWDTEATRLWESIDPLRWEYSGHNPVALLRDVEPFHWATLTDDPAFVRNVERVHGRFREYLGTPGWCQEATPEVCRAGVAYLSMEFGLHESIRSYSGGLGVLAGDHLRSASDLGVPMTGVGLLYREGYFHQVIDDGHQFAAYPWVDFHRLPVRPCTDSSGSPRLVEVPFGDRTALTRIFRLDVGRVRLYLLDTDHERNEPEDRALTRRLYGGTVNMRIRQEVLLGIGGIRALRAMGEDPAVFHLNEGHCAFAIVELAREEMMRGHSWNEALKRVRRRVAFTTHTPVPAGHDRFHWHRVNAVLGSWRNGAGLHRGAFMELGRVNPSDWHEPLNMTVLSLRGSSRANGVSRLHGEVSRRMFHGLWPERSVEDVPIGHVTNGVHPEFWMSAPARELFDAYCPRWREEVWDPEVWSGVDSIPDEELWALRRALRERLLGVVERRSGVRLDPDALTVGFARRFAPYKRANLLFTDPERLAAILEAGPVQVVFAGKAHPHDELGQGVLHEVLRHTSDRRFRNRVAFLDQHDIYIGGLLTSGADVWLNNPRRPMEASGTSGQKVVLNGGMNLSVLDGWWPEAWDGTNGWAIGDGRSGRDPNAQDAADARSLYEILESQVVPTWRERDERGLPTRWLSMVRRSIVTAAPRFNSHRMVRDYVLQAYAPLARELE